VRVFVRGIGAFGPGFENWQQLQHILAGGPANPEANSAPKPAIIPANERRRAPLAVRIAVETCSQAIAMSGLDAATTACVFASGLGDTELTDYMCRELAGPQKQLSPTKFHNSVHNAAAGYWTIATGCQQPANSVAGLEDSVAIALLEAVVQCVSEQKPVVIALYDTPTSEVLFSLFPNREAFGLALVITPEDDSGIATALDCTVISAEEPAWPERGIPDTLLALFRHNPAAKALMLAQGLAAVTASNLTLPLSRGSALQVTLTPHTALLADSQRKT